MEMSEMFLNKFQNMSNNLQVLSTELEHYTYYLEPSDNLFKQFEQDNRFHDFLNNVNRISGQLKIMSILSKSQNDENFC